MAPIGSSLNSALSGIQRGLSSASERAERISGGFTEDSADSVVNDIVGLKLDLYQVGANKKVIQVTQELDKYTLDIIA